MDIKTAKKVRDILNRLEQCRIFLKEYDKYSRKTIVVKQTWLSNLCETLEFGDDKDFEDSVRKCVVRKILDLEKQLEEIGMSEINLQEACQIVANELKKHGEFYDAYKNSVLSVFIESQIAFSPCELRKEISEKIVRRISGEE